MRYYRLVLIFYRYESEDGSSRQESGSPKFAPQPGVESYGGLTVSGRFSYASPEGKLNIRFTKKSMF